VPGSEGGHNAATPPTARPGAVESSQSFSGDELVGREGELRRIEQLLDPTGAVPRALLVDGPPGIGKTALWRAGIEHAAKRGFRLLLARPAEAEAALAFAALGDLLGEAVDAIGALPEPQRRALRVALLLDAPAGAAIETRSLCVAFLGLLRELSSDGPLLVGVDDVQWLDRPSASALVFALRRIDRVPVVFFGTARPTAAEFTFERLERIALGPLDLSSLDRIIRRSLGEQLPRPVLRRLERISGGNPFYALELARALTRRGESPPEIDSLPLPETLTEALRERISTLPDEARQALVATAALSTPTKSVVTAAVGDPHALDRAAHANVLVLDGERVRLEHPLVGSAAYAMQGDAERRELHRRLANSSPVTRIGHVISRTRRTAPTKRSPPPSRPRRRVRAREALPNRPRRSPSSRWS